MLPQAVFDLLQLDLKGSARLGDKGDVRGGRRLLLAGLDRSRQDLTAGHPWAQDLIWRYEAALMNFDRRYQRGEEP